MGDEYGHLCVRWIMSSSNRHLHVFFCWIRLVAMGMYMCLVVMAIYVPDNNGRIFVFGAMDMHVSDCDGNLCAS